jgi:hypothetical protein
MWLRYSGLLFAFVAAGAAALAGGDNRGVSAAQSCRNLATELTAQTTAPGGFVADMKTSCSFNAPAKQSTCTVQYSDRRGTSMTTTTITTYNSVADVVDEIAVNPPLSYALTATVSQTSGRGTPGSGVSNTFGDNRRILKTVNSSVGGESTTTYSEWDQAGRPTRANDVGKGFNNTRIISYDNGARTRTTVVNGGPLRTVETFDADGNQIETLATSGGMAVATKTTITVTASQRICK